MSETIFPATRRTSSFFGRVVTHAAVALFASLTATVALAQAANYTVVKPAQPTTAPAGKVEVIEFFGYWCPHCNEFEPTMNDWTRRNDAKIALIHVPIAFAPVQSGLQKLYYTLEIMGKERELRGKVFTAIHADRSLSPAPDTGAIAEWAAKNGLDKKVFLDTFNSFAVTTKVSRANQMAQAYGVTGVPMLGMGGKYLVSVDAKTIGNADTFLARVIGEK